MNTKTYFNPYKQFTGIFIPDWLMNITELSIPAKVLYAVLAKYAGKNGYCFPGQDTLAEKIGTSKRSVRTHIKELTEYGLIEKKRVGMGKTDRYYFIYLESLMGETMQSANVANIADQEPRAEKFADQERKKTSTQERKKTSTPYNIVLSESVGKESQSVKEGEFSQKIENCQTKPELLELWEMYRKSKGKHMNLYEHDVMLNRTFKAMSISQIKEAILYTVANGWFSLQIPESAATEEDNRHRPNYL